jgi:hypothetical protein
MSDFLRSREFVAIPSRDQAYRDTALWIDPISAERSAASGISALLYPLPAQGVLAALQGVHQPLSDKAQWRPSDMWYVVHHLVVLPDGGDAIGQVITVRHGRVHAFYHELSMVEGIPTRNVMVHRDDAQNAGPITNPARLIVWPDVPRPETSTDLLLISKLLSRHARFPGGMPVVSSEPVRSIWPDSDGKLEWASHFLAQPSSSSTADRLRFL